MTVSDGHGGAYGVVISVPITPANAVPTATVSVGSPNATTGVVAGAVIGADADGDTLSYSGSTTTTKRQRGGGVRRDFQLHTDRGGAVRGGVGCRRRGPPRRVHSDGDGRTRRHAQRSGDGVGGTDDSAHHVCSTTAADRITGPPTPEMR